MDFIRPGDILMVTRIDRLARSIGDLQDIVRELRSKGATLKTTEQPIDTSNAAGKAFLDILGVLAEFETNLRRERQMEGIVKAKVVGVYKGRPPTIDVEAVRKLRAEGKGVNVISHTLKISRASVYRALVGAVPSDWQRLYHRVTSPSVSFSNYPAPTLAFGRKLAGDPHRSDRRQDRRDGTSWGSWRLSRVNAPHKKPVMEGMG